MSCLESEPDGSVHHWQKIAKYGFIRLKSDSYREKLNENDFDTLQFN